jgi:hypothetical protein
MLTDVDNPLSARHYSAKHRRHAVDNDCGQMCMNSRDTRKNPREYFALTRSKLAREFPPIRRDFFER